MISQTNYMCSLLTKEMLYNLSLHLIFNLICLADTNYIQSDLMFLKLFLNQIEVLREPYTLL